MKRITLLVALLFTGIVSASAGKVAYKIHLKISDVKDSMVFLAHYYGAPLPKIYQRDSARFDRSGNADFYSTDSTFVGGIYMMLLSDRKTYFEVLLNKGDDMSITATISKLPEGVKFKNSPENERFQGYVGFLKTYSAGQDVFRKELETAKSASDTADIRKRAGKTASDLTNYRKDYSKKYAGTLLSNIFKALEVPVVPEGDHFLEDGKTKDSTFAYHYYKAHFWDDFNYQDDRLIHTPLLDGKLDEYMNKLVLPWPDSVEHESDMLLKKARGTKDLFKYTLYWLTRNVENSKVMGMDEVFVYLVENYYMKGDAFWLSHEDLQKYIDRARKIAPNVIGNVVPELKLPNVTTKKEESLNGVKAKYTLLVFYSPNCGHCQHEIPALDSAYKAGLKDKGVKIYTVSTEGDEKSINDFIKKNKMDEWTNTWDPQNVGDYHNRFDVYSTPTVYLMDERKIIIGKRLDHSNIGSVIDMTEKKAKDKAASAKKKP